MQVPEDSGPSRRDIPFPELKELLEYLEGLEDGAESSIAYFRYGTAGYENQVKPGTEPSKTSKASTATCLAYLAASGRLAEPTWEAGARRRLRSSLINGSWRSAGLEENNPFTTSFLLEAIDTLGGLKGVPTSQVRRVESKIRLLNRHLATSGGLAIKSYPQTAFLTHKVVRVLSDWGRLSDSARDASAEWTWSQLYQESMLIASDSPDADYFELAYSVITASLTSELDRMTPRQRRLLRHAIGQFFSGQREDGTWPRSRPLFLYPNIGYAYCFDFELLVQLLRERPLRPFLFPHLDALRRSARALYERRVPLGNDSAYGWSSEHHGGRAEAESWPTASVLHFCFEFKDLVLGAVRQDVFRHVDAVYEDPRDESGDSHQLLSTLLDSEVKGESRSDSFKALIQASFLNPLIAGRDRVRDGQPFPDDVPVSAILYGPPGTSKTQFARLVAASLGWPLLSLDPSHLTRRGLENVYAEANGIFDRLRFADQIVVLMDEFDELVREREGTGQLESRFLTTAMLPKIAALHDRRRLVYLVATNHLEQFDAAISRPGRFDVIVPLMPPTAQAKLARWPDLADARKRLIAAGGERLSSTQNSKISLSERSLSCQSA